MDLSSQLRWSLNIVSLGTSGNSFKLRSSSGYHSFWRHKIFVTHLAPTHGKIHCHLAVSFNAHNIFHAVVSVQKFSYDALILLISHGLVGVCFA